MKVVFTDEALANLDGILSFIASNYPSIYDAFQSRLRSVVARIGDWPESAQTGRRAPRKWPTGRAFGLRHWSGIPTRCSIGALAK